MYSKLAEKDKKIICDLAAFELLSVRDSHSWAESQCHCSTLS